MCLENTPLQGGVLGATAVMRFVITAALTTIFFFITTVTKRNKWQVRSESLDTSLGHDV